MLVQLSWLKEFVDLNNNIDAILDKITVSGIEIEGTTKLANDDLLIEFAVPPNRGDCMSIKGIARELVGLGLATYKPHSNVQKYVDFSGNDTKSIKVQTPDLCPLYLGLLIKGIDSNTPTPSFVKNRLSSLGMGGVNCVVDIANYVMFEFGQPLHAFDADKLDGEIVVRAANAKEKFLALGENEEIKLGANFLVIADASKVQAVAGVVGGQLSCVDSNTKNIFLEAALFEPSGYINNELSAIGLTARKINKLTDAAQRFSKSIDPFLIETVVNRFIEILSSIQPNLKISQKFKYNGLDITPCKIALNNNKAREYIGCNIEDNFIKTTLLNLGFKIEEKSIGELNCIVPSFRKDVTNEFDLYEEVARCYGLDNIPYTLPAMKSEPILSKVSVIDHKLRSYFQSKGLQEVINYSFIAENHNKPFLGNSSPIVVANPISNDMSQMRSSLLPGLLKNLSLNINNYNEDIALYEFGKSYNRLNDNTSENHKFAIALTGLRFDLSWDRNNDKFDFFDIKGLIEGAIEYIYPSSTYILKFEVMNEDMYKDVWHPTRSAKLLMFDNSTGKQEFLGIIGQLSKSIGKEFDLKKVVYAAEIDFQKLTNFRNDKAVINPLSKFPPSDRDIALVVRKEIQSQSIIDTIRRCNILNLKNIKIFDIYRGKELGDENLSIALRLTWHSDTETLHDKDIKDELNLILERLKTEWGATLRD